MSFTPTVPLPLIFGGVIACGLPGDELTGPVKMPLYTTGYASMAFKIPQQEPSIRVAFCMVQQGAPTADVTVGLYSSGILVASASILPSEVPATTPGWTAFVELVPGSDLLPGTYSLRVSSPTSTSTDCYLVYINLYTSFVDTTASASYTPPPGVDGNRGSPVVWIKDPSNVDLMVFPFGWTSASVPPMQFVTDGSYQINALAPWLSDMEYLLPPYTASFVLTDVTAGKVVGTAAATQYYNSHGIQGIVPLQFPSAITLTAGHTYSITISETGNASATSAYPILIRGVNLNPATASPTGFGTYWLGELLFSDYQYRMLDYPGTTTTTQNGHGGIGGTDAVSVRFVPRYTDTITNFRLKMSNVPGAPPDPTPYPPGNQVVVSLLASNEAYQAPEFASPTGPVLYTAAADSGTVPHVGFLDVPVSFPVTANVPYWMTVASPTAPTSAYSCERCVSPYRNLALSSTGSSWFFFGQGPTDLSWAATTSQETIGSPFDATISASLSSSSLVAQPFTLDQDGSVNSVFVEASGGTVVATVYPDGGSGPMMGSPLGSGTFNMAFSYFYSGIVVPFSTNAAVTAKRKYWVVFSSETTSSMPLATYWTRPSDPDIPIGYEAMISTDGGGSWSQPNSEVGSAIFMVGVVPEGGPILTPTVLTLTAKVV